MTGFWKFKRSFAKVTRITDNSLYSCLAVVIPGVMLERLALISGDPVMQTELPWVTGRSSSLDPVAFSFSFLLSP